MPTISKWLYWPPRILASIFVLFLFLMSLDVFSMNASISETLLALLMHNIPALILLVLLIISWKHEFVGAVTFLLAGLIYIILLMQNPFEWYYLAWAVQISGMAFLVGVLFLLGWRKKRAL